VGCLVSRFGSSLLADVQVFGSFLSFNFLKILFSSFPVLTLLIIRWRASSGVAGFLMLTRVKRTDRRMHDVAASEERRSVNSSNSQIFGRLSGGWAWYVALYVAAHRY